MPRPQRGDAEIIREAKKLFERCVAWESTARFNALADRRFACGDAYNNYQWIEKVREGRGDRPSLTHNKVRQHNLQIVNDARQNKAQIKVTPTGGHATYEAAEVFSGIIRRIEYQSKAIDAYSTATYHQVESGIGWVKVETDYTSSDSFELDIFIRRVANPDTIYVDPDCKEYDKSDATFAFVFEEIPRHRWEEEHGPHAAPPPAALDYTGTGSTWVSAENVRVAQYWRRNTDVDRLHMLADGRAVRESDLDDTQMEVLRPLIQQTREMHEDTVEWFRIEGDKITDRGDWPGKYIPLVPFIGEETVIDKVLDRKGHTRSQIDAQRIYNYWASSAVEHVALQTKVPFIAASKAIENFENYWYTANTKNHAVLPFNATDDDGNPIPPPQRAPPPDMAQAYVQGMMIARQDLLDVTGQYQAELGMPSNERSGVAINARQRQGDNATYHYIDNQAKAIRQIGRILIDLIPKVYDTARVTKIMALDGTDSDVIVAPGAPQSHQRVIPTPQGPMPVGEDMAAMAKDSDNTPDPRIIFNPNVGRYDVEADVGPSFGTQRQEAANAFAQIMANNPAAFQLVGDFWAQNSDFPGADELAERLKKGLPPQYQAGAPNPQVLQLQQASQQMQQKAQQLLQQADAEIATQKAEVVRLREHLADRSGDTLAKHRQVDIDDYRAETERLKAVGAIDPQSLQMIVRQLVKDMLQTELVPALQHHAAMGQALAAAEPPMPPQQPGNGGNGQVAQQPSLQGVGQVGQQQPLQGLQQGQLGNGGNGGQQQAA